MFFKNRRKSWSVPLDIEPDKVEEIIAMLKNGLEEAEVESEEEAEELIAEANASLKGEKTSAEPESTDPVEKKERT